MASFDEKLQQLSKNRHFRHFLPFMVFLAFGCIGMREFSQTRYVLNNKTTSHSSEEFDALMLKKNFAKRRKTLQEHIDEMLHTDTSNWINIRGPRPGEDSRIMQAEQRRKLREQ